MKALRWSEEQLTSYQRKLATAIAPERLELTLPWPPSGNHRLGLGKRGQHYQTPAYREFRARVAEIVAANGLNQPYEQLLRVECYLTPPHRRRFDLDNFWKPTADALQGCGVYVDDSQITDLRLAKLAPASPGAILVRIEPL